MSATDFSFLDLDQFRVLYSDADASKPKINFYVGGIRCSNCLAKIESLKTEIEGLEEVRVNLANHQAEVILQSPQASFAKFAEGVQAKGFKIFPLKKTDSLSEVKKKEGRKDLVRLGVAAFCASNIMMFAFSVYFGAAEGFENFFNWLSFFLYLPVLLFVAQPFYKGFYHSIKSKQISIDGPLAVASVVGFLFSFVNLIRGQGSLYFDSLSGFLFLITLSRFVQKRLQSHFLNFETKFSEDSISRAKIQTDTGFEWRPVQDIKNGDIALIEQGMSVPVDGVLLSDKVSLDTKFLTGESRPRNLTSGMSILAGSRLLSERALVQVSASGSNTNWGKWITKINSENLVKTNIQNLADVYSQRLLWTVFILAALVVIYFFPSQPVEGFERALALLIVACPCAMAFGTPLALSFSIKNAFRKGFLIKSAGVFEKLTKIQNTVFDKTGTLTYDKVIISSSEPAILNDEELALVRKLESVSFHPIAEGLREYLKDKKLPDLQILDLQEIPGKGIRGVYQNKIYELRSSSDLTGKKSVALFREDKVVCHFFYSDSAIAGAEQLIQKLKQRRQKIFLLSGDSDKYVKNLAAELRIENYLANQSPEMKEQFLASLENSLMIGDGVNDSLAFRKASVGIAVNGSAELALRSADVYLLSGSVADINSLFDISFKAIKLIKQNLNISIVYNVIAGGLAIFGFMNPLLAALLMPISSGFILLSSWWGSRS